MRHELVVHLQLLMRAAGDEGDEVELDTKRDNKREAPDCRAYVQLCVGSGRGGQPSRAMKPDRIASGGLPTFHLER